jgi:hypothetical protein
MNMNVKFRHAPTARQVTCWSVALTCLTAGTLVPFLVACDWVADAALWPVQHNGTDVARTAITYLAALIAGLMSAGVGLMVAAPPAFVLVSLARGKPVAAAS